MLNSKLWDKIRNASQEKYLRQILKNELARLEKGKGIARRTSKYKDVGPIWAVASSAEVKRV